MGAVYALLFRRSKLTPIQAAALICIWSAVFFVPIYFFFCLSRFALASPGKIALQIVYKGVLMSGVAIVTFNRAVSCWAARRRPLSSLFFPPSRRSSQARFTR